MAGQSFQLLEKVCPRQAGVMGLVVMWLLAAGLVVQAAEKANITEYPLAAEGHRPQAICVGPDGNLWVTEVLKHSILRVTPAGEITQWVVPGENVGVIQGICAADKSLYVTS